MKKKGVIYSVLILVVFAIAILFLTGERVRQSLMAQFESRLISRSQINADTLSHNIAELKQSVSFLTKVPPVSGMMRASVHGKVDPIDNTPLHSWKQRLETIFTAYLETNPEMLKVSFIGVAAGGRELIRAQRDGGKPYIVPDDQLQVKGDRDYFQAIAKLGNGNMFVSDFYLNREQGKVQIPIVPTLLVGAPVFQADGKLFGMIVINVSGRELIAPMEANMPAQFKVYLTNSEGDFVLHPDTGRTFGFNLGKRWRWDDEFRPVAETVQNPGAVEDYVSASGVIHVITKKIILDENEPGRFLKVSIGVPDSVVMTAVNNAYISMLYAILAASMLVGGILYMHARQRSKVFEQQARLSSIVENSHDAIIGNTLEGKVTSWNKGAEEVFGYTAQEAVGHLLVDLIIPIELVVEEADILSRLRKGEVVLNFTTVRRRRDGIKLDVSLTVSPIRNDAGRIVGVSKIVRDITAQRAAEAQIRELNSSLERQVMERTAEIEGYLRLQRAILADAPYAVIATDVHGTITLFNPAAEHLIGYSSSEMVNKQTPAKFHDSVEVVARAEAFSSELGETIQPGFDVFVAKARRNMPNEYEWTYIRKDGSRVPVLLSVSALRNDDGVINGFLGIAVNISERAQNQRQLELMRDQLLEAAQVAKLGIWTWNLDDNTLEWNVRMVEMYGLPDELRGSGLYFEHWRARVHPDDVDDVSEKLKSLVEGTGIYDPVFRIICSDGSIRFIQAAAQVERDEKGRALRVLGINRDITQERELTETFRNAMEAADSANRAKSEFVANMSHEIRSPMNAVVGMLQLLKRSNLDKRQRDYASKAEEAAGALLGVLNDILDFSKIESGKMVLDPHPFSLDKLLRNISVIMSANVGTKPIDLVFDIDPAFPDWVIGDELRLQQILLNLTGNAIKFTEHGEIVLSAKLKSPAHESDKKLIEFAVRDSGIGISPDQSQRIFNGFTQAEASTARRFGGSGLGLAISQKLVQLMGGNLGVDSVPGQGSTFYFAIEYQPASAQCQVEALLSAPLRNLDCLVVDDNASMRAAIAGITDTFGWKSELIDNGIDAISAVARRGEHNPYDVVLIDCRMPSPGGWETGLRIRQLSPAVKTTLIAIASAHEYELMIGQQVQHSDVFDGVLVKPMTASMLFDVVADARSDKHPTHHLAPDVTDASDAAKLTQRRLTGIHLLLVDDNITNQQVASELLSFEGAKVKVVDSGAGAIDAVQRTDVPFDVVLMDIQMPEMDGYTATRLIHERFGDGAPPVIAMTANALASDRENALAAGMVDHVGKPFDLTHLVSVILKQVHRNPAPVDDVALGGAVGAVGTVVADTVSSKNNYGIDSSGALARFCGNKQIYQRALNSFAVETASFYTRLKLALSEHRRDDAMLLLHTLKGVAATVGANQLSRIAAELEKALKNTVSGKENHLLAEGHVLQETCLQMTKEAHQLAIQFDMPAVADVAGVAEKDNELDFRDGIKQLSTLLAASSMEAFPLFERLRKQYGNDFSTKYAKLTLAIEHMEFAEAVRECDYILSMQGTEIHE